MRNQLDETLLAGDNVEFENRAGLIVQVPFRCVSSLSLCVCVLCVHVPPWELLLGMAPWSNLLSCQIPCSVKIGKVPVTAVVEIGHGLFWGKSVRLDYFNVYVGSPIVPNGCLDRGFARSRWARQQASEKGWILWSMDWRGLTRHDLPQFARLLMYDLGKVTLFLQSFLVQGFSDKLVGAAVVNDIVDRYCSKGRCGNTVPPTSPSSPSSLPSSYIGLSLGAVMGGGWTAFYPHHLRTVLVAGGSSISFLLGRSDLFGLYVQLCDLQFYSRFVVCVYKSISLCDG